MKKFNVRASLAYWKARLAYRRRRHAYWHKKNDPVKAAHWHHRIDEARGMVALRERQLREGMVNPARGIDVSNLQGAIDFNKVREAGYEFVYVKAGEGDWSDPDFERNVVAATQAGLKVGAYQFLRPRAGRTGAQEAAYFLKRLAYAKLGEHDLRPVLDVEATALDRAGTHAYVRSFVNAMKAHGHRPIIYTGTWFWNQKVGDDDFGCPLWIAAYQSSEPKLPVPWTEYVIWQHSSKGRVPGVSGDVDLNRTDDLRKVTA